MAWLILGLVLFLGVHSVRIVAEDWRTRTIARLGEGRWKGGYTLLSLAGLALIVYGYHAAWQAPVALWAPPVWTRHLAALLMLLSFVLLAATYVPGNALKAAIGHPMVVAVKVWALAHLLANHTLADVVLFGSFLVWAVLDFRAARARDRAAGTVHARGPALRTVLTVVIGLVAWAVFSIWLHGWLFGVRPFG